MFTWVKPQKKVIWSNMNGHEVKAIQLTLPGLRTFERETEHSERGRESPRSLERPSNSMARERSDPQQFFRDSLHTKDPVKEQYLLDELSPCISFDELWAAGTGEMKETYVCVVMCAQSVSTIEKFLRFD